MTKMGVDNEKSFRFQSVFLAQNSPMLLPTLFLFGIVTQFGGDINNLTPARLHRYARGITGKRVTEAVAIG